MSGKSIAITAFLIIAVGAGAFYGGMVYGKGKTNSSEPSRMRSQGMEQNRVGTDGPPRLAGEAGGFVNGEIISKDDSSITVKTGDGGSKIVYFSDSTVISKSTEGASFDLAAGQQVMVNGKAGSDGTLTAQNIQIRPAQ